MKINTIIFGYANSMEVNARLVGLKCHKIRTNLKEKSFLTQTKHGAISHTIRIFHNWDTYNLFLTCINEMRTSDKIQILKCAQA